MVKEDKKVEEIKKESKTKKAEIQKDDRREVKSGDIVRIYEKIREKNAKGEMKERLQLFEGIVLARKHGNEKGATITVQKESGGIKVEKIFPVNSPIVDRIKIVGKIKSSRSKLYYLRNYQKKLKKVVLQ